MAGADTFGRLLACLACIAAVSPAIKVAATGMRGMNALASSRRLLHGGGVDWPLASPVYGLSLHNISGVWEGLGDQYSSNEWAAYFKENSLPDCSKEGTAPFTYKHWNEAFPDVLALWAGGDNGGSTLGINGHEGATYGMANVTFDGEYMRYIWVDFDEAGCNRFVPYVDTRTGLLLAQYMHKTEWRRVDGNVETTDLSCHVLASETAGCYPQPDGSVHTVAVTTYRCRGGACLQQAPAFLEQQAGDDE